MAFIQLNIIQYSFFCSNKKLLTSYINVNRSHLSLIVLNKRSLKSLEEVIIGLNSSYIIILAFSTWLLYKVPI